jgi:KaiC/GvpD/RAD55 family RecA-like ATPase
MVKKELIERSPLRLLEKSIHGGVGKGNIGVIAARKGTGKTACLVHIATDQLFQDKHVIHVSFSGRTDHIISWYEDIFSEIAKKRSLEGAMDIHDELIKNRVILNFNQHGVTREQFLRSISALIDDGHFSADVIVVDGYDFSTGEPETLRVLREFAVEHNLAVWFTATTHRDDPQPDENDVPFLLKSFIEDIAVIITLTPEQDHLKLRLVKDHNDYRREDLHLELDSRTLLIREG